MYVHVCVCIYVSMYTYVHVRSSAVSSVAAFAFINPACSTDALDKKHRLTIKKKNQGKAKIMHITNCFKFFNWTLYNFD